MLVDRAGDVPFNWYDYFGLDTARPTALSEVRWMSFPVDLHLACKLKEEVEVGLRWYALGRSVRFQNQTPLLRASQEAQTTTMCSKDHL